jgi:lipopolysaccharide heptosyltransferase II
VRRALLYLKGGMGDVVFALSLIADLRAGWPDVELWALSHAQGQGVLDLCPEVTRTLCYGPASSEPSLRVLLETLAGQRFDAAFTPVRSPRAAYVLFRSRAPIRVGFGGGPEALLYTHRAPVRPFEVAFSRRFERLAEAVGLRALGRPAPLVVSAARRARALEQLGQAGWDGESPLVSIHAGGGWPTKQWPVEHAAALAALLFRRHGLRTLLVGGDADRARAEAIAARSDGAALLQVGNPVAEALAQLDACTAAVGLDSGLSHAGVALGVPTVSLFGPNEPASVILAPHQRMLVQSALPCRPCNRLGRLRCPLGHHLCMRDTTPGQVLAALEPLLALGEVRLRAHAARRPG